MYPIMRNYRLDWSLARSTMPPPPKNDTTRLKLIAPLIKLAVEWGMELKDKSNVPALDLWTPPFWEEMISRGYPVEKARALCFNHLYGTITDYSNAILRLIEDSYGSVSFGLLQSVMESYAKCHFISKSMESRQTICHDYIATNRVMVMCNVLVGEPRLRHRQNTASMVEMSKERH